MAEEWQFGDGGVRRPSIRRRLWWFFVLSVLVAGAVAYFRLVDENSRTRQELDTIKSRLATMVDSGVTGDTAVSAGSMLGNTTASNAGSAPYLRSSGGFGSPASAREIKRHARQDPVVIAASYSALMAGEPHLPEMERRQYDWLRDSAQAISSGAPSVADLQTLCQGRRCVVSGTFASDEDARTWARRFLLSGGGRLLSGSNIVTKPSDNAGAVDMQIFLY